MAAALAAIAFTGDALIALSAAPLERMKLMLQTQSLPSVARARPPCGGLLEVATRLRERGGLASLWHGAGAEVARRKSKVLIRGILDMLSARDSTIGLRRSGADAVKAAIGLTITYPLSLARARLAVGADMAAGTLSTWRRVCARRGVKALYDGLLPALGALAVSRVVFFVSYVAMSAGKKGEGPEMRQEMVHWVRSQVAGMLAVVVAHPLHTVQARVAVAAGTEDEFEGPRDCAKKLYEGEGVRGFYKGLLASLLVSFIEGGMLVPLYNSVWYAAIKSSGTPVSPAAPVTPVPVAHQNAVGVCPVM